MRKRYACLMSLLFCGSALAFEGNAGNAMAAGGAAAANTEAREESAASKSATANRVSKPGEYTGYSDAIYDDTYALTSQYVRMSDGTKLAMDLYRPKDKATGKVIDTKLPVLWMHTPYNRRYSDNNKTLTGEGYPGTAARLVKYGYVVAIVDFRGLYASYGHNVAFNRGEWLSAARRDAYDITEWLAAQPWSNGKIGMWGCSATGGSQLQAATTQPPHLKAIFPMSCEFDAYSFRVPGGMAAAKSAGTGIPSKAQAGQKSRDAAAEPVDGDTDRSQLNQAIADHANTVESEGYAPYRNSIAEAITDPGAQPWWIKSSPHYYLEQIKASQTAMYLAANWDEGPTKHGAFFTFNNVTNPAKLIVGPGGHCGWTAVQSQTRFDITVEEHRFFDYWLKGIDNGIMKEDRVYYYTYNAPAGTEWRSARQWPLPNEKRTRFYLDKGVLSAAEPTEVDGKDETTVAYDVTPANMTAKGLVYTTAPLRADVQVTGHPTINLWVSSTATDGDFVATIQDVAPDGTATSYNVTGRIRASLRKLQDAPYNNLGLPWHGFNAEDVAPLTPGQPTELVFEILPISMIFRAGHSIRLVINFADARSTPRLDPAPKVAIYRDSTHKSYVTLPIIEVLAQDNAEPAPGFIGEQGGRGPLPAVAQSRADLRTHTLYRPVSLPAEPLPLLIWGNGGCSDNGLSHDKFLRNIASHGYVVIALGYAWRRPQRANPAGQEKDPTEVAQMSQAMTWAAMRTADPADELFGHINTSRIAVAGHSCGGLQAIKISADPRISTSMIFDSGVYNKPGGISKIRVSKDELANLHGPIAYFTGGPTDVAHVNASDDAKRITHVPVFFGWLPVGHGGTFSAPDGGDWAEVAVHWLDWQLKGNRAAGDRFLGKDCGLCRDKRWTVEQFARP